MNLYKNSYGGLIQFADPKLSFYINNSIGIPVGINLNAILFNTKNNNKLTLAGGIPKPWYIKYPVKLGTTAFDTLKLSKATGSNINVLVNNNAPTLLLTSADMTTNPASNPNVKNFLLDTSHVNVDEQVELPFYGTASGFILQDTINFNYENTIQGNNSQVDIEYVNFLIQTTNYFPVSANLQVYLTDSTKKILIDSLLDSKTNFIAAATPGPAPNFYLTIPVKNSVQKISVDNTRTAKWNNVKFLILRANLATINNGTTPVKIYSNNTLAVDIGIQTQVNANIKINK